jgi:SAM-dependent methyltransferase
VDACPGVSSLVDLVRTRTIRSACHDEIYDATYCEIVDRSVRQTMEVLAEQIVADYRPRTVLDAGCGAGALLASLRSRGVEGIGLEYSEPALRICRERGLTVYKFDIRTDVWSDAHQVDVAVSTEVAEHLPVACADRLVALLCGAADTVVFTAAPPGQGGTDHVNEQPPEYWIARFAEQRFGLDDTLTPKWRSVLEAKRVVPFYHRNLLLFKREERRSLAEAHGVTKDLRRPHEV